MVQGGLARWLVVCLSAAALFLGAATGASASAYFGATIGGETYGQTGNAPRNLAAWETFERHAGKRVAIVNQGQLWATFDKVEVEATAARGAIPLVTMGLAEGVTLESIADGSQDAAIKKWAQEAKAFGRPFLFAPWWEMNGAWYAWGRSPRFIDAWRHFHDLVAAQGATNVTWTWVVNSIWSDPDSNPSPYYPGDSYVDWTGIDSYNWGLNPAQPDRWISPNQALTPTLKIVRELAPGKPVAIVEDAASEYGGNKADWIREMVTTYLPHHPEVSAYLWFNWNFPKNGVRHDWQIESSAPAQQQFRQAIQSGIYAPAPVSLPLLTKVPPPAAGSPDPPQAADLSEPAELASGPDLAVAPDGSAVFVWSARAQGSFVVYMRRVAPDGTRGPAVELSNPTQDAMAPQVAIAPDGTATVAWSRFDGKNFLIQARRLDPQGVPEAAVATLSRTGRNAVAPQLDVAPDGTATIVWKRFDGAHDRIEERRITPGGALQPAESANQLSAEEGDAVEPAVVSAADGGSTVVWSRYDGTSSIVQERQLDSAGSVGAAVDLSAAGASAIEPQVAVAPDGDATVVWTRFDGANWAIQGQRLNPAGVAAGAVENLSAAGGDAVQPQLAIGPGGEATAVWERFDGSSFVVQARRISPAGVLGASALNLSAAGGDAAEPRVAIAPTGTASVLWSRFDGSDWIVQRRDIAADGSLGAAAGLSTPGRRAGAPTLAWGGSGGLAIGWRRFAGAGDVIQARMISPPPHPPQPPPPSPPPPPPVEPQTSGTRAASPKPSKEPGSAPAAASLRIEKVILNRRQGTATLRVAVSGAGRLTLAGAVPRSQTLDGAATAALRVVPKPAKRRLLRRDGALRLQVTVTFQPRGGSPLSRRLALALRQSRRGSSTAG